MSTFTRLAVAALVAFSFSSGAALADKTPSGKTLYERLGGKPALTAVVNELWTVVAADARINGRFGKTDPKVFGGQLVEFLCQGSGGPCKYKGADMKAAHTGMMLTDAEFTALAEDTVKALDKFKVPATEKNEVIALLGSMKADVINH